MIRIGARLSVRESDKNGHTGHSLISTEAPIVEISETTRRECCGPSTPTLLIVLTNRFHHHTVQSVWVVVHQFLETKGR